MNAYQHTEDLWWDNIKKINDARYVLIAEAPLYGNKCSYIYNLDSKGTPFFGVSTTLKLLRLVGNETNVKNKKEMIQSLKDLGIVIIDIFPFAFNNETKYQYGKLNEKRRYSLAKLCSEWYLKPKIEEIYHRSNRDLVFGVRYKRLYSFACHLIKSTVPVGTIPKIQLACKQIANAPLDLQKISKILL